MLTVRHRLVSVHVVALLLAATAAASAQQRPAEQGIGVVTAIEGQASVARQALPEPVSLRFRDDVFFRDQINTRERSTVRLLLGGKGVLTVREQSQVTLDESVAPDGTRRSVLGLLVGKIGAAISRELMRRGELVEIRTPNAVAAVRGTVLIAEYIPPEGKAESSKPVLLASSAPGALLAQAPAVAGGVSNFFVLSGEVTITPQGQAPIMLGPLQAVTVTAPPSGAQAGAIQNITPAQAAQAAQGLEVGKPHKGEAEQSKTAQAQARVAAAVANAIVQAITGEPAPAAEAAPQQPASEAAPDTAAAVSEAAAPTPPPAAVPAPTTTVAPVVPNVIQTGSVVPITNNLPGINNPGNQISAEATAPSLQISAGDRDGDTLSYTATGLPPGLSISTTTGLITGTLNYAAAGTYNPTVTVDDAKGGTASVSFTWTVANVTQNVLPTGPILSLNNVILALAPDTPLATFSTGDPPNAVLPIAMSGDGTTVVAITSPLLIATGNPITHSGVIVALDSGAAISGASSDTTTPLVKVDGTAVINTGGAVFNLSGGSALTTFGPVLRLEAGGSASLAGLMNIAGGSEVALGPADALVIQSGSSLTATDSLFSVTGGSVLGAYDGAGLVSMDPSTLTLAAPILSVTDSSVNLAGPVLRALNSTVTGNAGARLVALQNATLELSETSLLESQGSTLSFAGPMVTVTNSPGSLYSISPGTPLLSVSGGSLALTGSGALLVATTASVDIGGSLLAASEGATINATGATGPLVQLTDAYLSLSGGDSLISLSGWATLNASGPLLSLAGTTPCGEGCGANLTIWDHPALGLGEGTSATLGGGLWVTNAYIKFLSESDPSVFEVPAGTSLTFAGPALNLTDSFLSVSGSLLSVSGGLLRGTTADPLIKLTGSMVQASGSAVAVEQGGTMILAGPLLAATDSDFNLGGGLLALSGASLTSATPNPLISLSGGSVTLGDTALLMSNNATANLSGPLFKATDASLSAATGAPLLSLTGSALTVRGPFLDLTNSPLDLGTQPVAMLTEGSTFRNTAGPVIRITNGSLTADALVISDGTGNTINLTGTILDLANALVQLRTLGDVPHTDSGTITHAAGEPEIRMVNSDLTLTGAGESLISPGGATQTTYSGLGLIATNDSETTKTISLAGPLLLLWGVNLTATDPYVQLSNMTVSETGSDALISVEGPASSAKGPLLAATNSDFSVGGTAFLALLSGSTLTVSGSTSPLVSLSGGTVNLGTGVSAITLDNATANISGPLFKASNVMFSGTTGVPFMTLNAASLTAGGPFLDLINTHLNIGNQPLVSLSGASTLANTAGPLIRLNGGSLTADAFGWSDATGNIFNTTGTILDLSNATVTLRTMVEGGEETSTHTVSLAAGEPFIRMTDSSMTLTEAGESLIPVPVPATSVDGLGLIASEGTITLAGPLLSLEVTLTATDPYIQLTNMTVVQSGSMPNSLIEAVNSPGSPISLSGPLLSATGSFLFSEGSLLDVGNAVQVNSTTPGPLVQLTNTSVTTASHIFTVRDAGTAVNLIGPLLTATGTSFSVADGASFLRVTGGATISTAGTTGAVVQLTNATLNLSNGGSLVSLNAGASVTGSGIVLDSTNSQITIDGPIFALRGGSSFNQSGGPVIRLSGGSLTAQGGYGDSDETGNLVTIAGTLLDATNASISLGNLDLVPDAGPRNTDVVTFSAPDGVPQISLTNSTLTDTSTWGLLEFSQGTSTYAGLLLVASDSTITLGGGLLEVCCGDQVTATSTDPLIQLTGSTVTSGRNLLDISRGSPTDTPPSLTVAGPLLSGSGSTFSVTGHFMRVRDGATLTYNSTLPSPPALLQFSGSTVGMNGNLFSLGSGPGQPGSTVTLAGPLLSATNSMLDSGPVSTFITVNDGATFTSTTTDPLLTVSGGSLTTKGHVGRAGFSSTATGVPTGSQAPVSMTLNGPFLTGTDTTITATRAVLSIRDGATFTSTTSSPLIQLGGNPGSTLTLGGPDPDPASPTFGQQINGQVFGVNPGSLTPPAAASAELFGPVLSATNTTISTTDRIIGIFGQTGASATLTSHTTDPLVQLTGGTVTMSGTFYPPTTTSSGTYTDTSGRFLRVWSPDPAAPATLTLAGPLLSASGTTFDGHNHFIGIGTNAQLTSTGTGPLVDFHARKWC